MRRTAGQGGSTPGAFDMCRLTFEELQGVVLGAASHALGRRDCGAFAAGESGGSAVPWWTF